MAESSGIDVSEEDLLISARTVIHSCLEVREHENVLIVTDTKTTKIARAVYEASSEVTSRVLMMMMPELEEQGIEPPSPVSDLMRRQDVIFLLTTKSMTHTRARATASREGARIASIPGAGVESFA
ncbi:MAG: aminopeptidase, partial [Candidatus Thalassarchaeaceae archaeon]